MRAPRLAPLDRPARKRGRPAVPPLWWRHDARLGAAGEDEAKKAAARLRLGGAREGGLLVASQLREALLERDTHLLAVLEYEDGVRKLLRVTAALAAEIRVRRARPAGLRKAASSWVELARLVERLLLEGDDLVNQLVW